MVLVSYPAVGLPGLGGCDSLRWFDSPLTHVPQCLNDSSSLERSNLSLQSTVIIDFDIGSLILNNPLSKSEALAAAANPANQWPKAIQALQAANLI